MLRDFHSKLTFDGLPAAEQDRRSASVIVPSAEGAAVWSGLTPEAWRQATDELFDLTDSPVSQPVEQSDGG